MLLLHLATESGQPDKVEEWGRRLTSQQVTEFMAYYDARQHILDAGRAGRADDDELSPEQRAAMEETELRATFRAHNARLSA